MDVSKCPEVRFHFLFFFSGCQASFVLFDVRAPNVYVDNHGHIHILAWIRDTPSKLGLAQDSVPCSCWRRALLGSLDD